MSVEPSCESSQVLRPVYNHALQEAKPFFHAYTGFIHYSYKKGVHEHLCIPIWENALYALALMRSRTVQGIQEASLLLEKILAFSLPLDLQGQQACAFPVHIHTFPKVSHWELQVKLSHVFLLILRNYRHVLSPSLKKNLEDVLGKLLVFASSKFAHEDSEAKKKELDAQLSFLLQTNLLLFKKMKGLDFQNELEQVESFLDLKHILHLDLRNLSLICLAISSLFSSKELNLSKALSQLAALYHEKMKSYCGIFYDVFLQGKEQEYTFFHHFFAYLFAQDLPSSQGLQMLSAVCLEVLPPKYRGQAFAKSLQKKEEQAFMMKKENFTISYLEGKHTRPCRGFYPFVASTFESKDSPFFLALEQGDYELHLPSFKESSNMHQACVYLDLQAPPADAKKLYQDEVFLHFTKFAQEPVFVEGKRSSTLYPQQCLSFLGKSLEFSLTYTVQSLESDLEEGQDPQYVARLSFKPQGNQKEQDELLDEKKIFAHCLQFQRVKGQGPSRICIDLQWKHIF